MTKSAVPFVLTKHMSLVKSPNTTWRGVVRGLFRGVVGVCLGMKSGREESIRHTLLLRLIAEDFD